MRGAHRANFRQHLGGELGGSVLWLVRVEPGEHLLQLEVGAQVDAFLAVDATRSYQGRVESANT